MSILTKASAPVKGTATLFTLDKAALAAVTSVAADAYFSDSANWKSVNLFYHSSVGNQHEVVKFEASQSSPTSKFLVSEQSRDIFEIQKIVIKDFDGGTFEVLRSELTTAESEFDVNVAAPVVPISSSLVSQLSQETQISNITADNSVAQSFEFQTAKTISSIDFYLRKNASFIVDSTIKMEILKTSDLSLVATSDIVSASAITSLSNQDPNAVKFTFSNVALEANVSYFAKISVVSNVDFFSGIIQVLGDTSNPYPYGNAYFFANGSWNNFTGIDYMFEIFGT